MTVFQSNVFETGVFGTSSMTLNKTKVYLGDAEIMQIVHSEDLFFKTMPQDAEVAPNIEAIALSTLGPVKVGDTVRVSGVTYRSPPQPTPVLVV